MNQETTHGMDHCFINRLKFTTLLLTTQMVAWVIVLVQACQWAHARFSAARADKDASRGRAADSDFYSE